MLAGTDLIPQVTFQPREETTGNEWLFSVDYDR